MKAPELPALTGIRTYAALSVFFHHVGYIPGLQSLPQQLGMPFLGDLGVTIFFVLSGFILTYNYGKLFRSEVKISAYGKYLWQRFSKIYPLHICTLLLAIPLTLLSPGLTMRFEALPLHLLLIHSFWIGGAATTAFNQTSWSLSCEAFFYLLFPFLLLRLQKAGYKNFLRGSCILFILILAIICLGCVYGTNPSSHYWFKYFPPARLPDFLAGVLLGIQFEHQNCVPPQRGGWMQLFGIICLCVPFLFGKYIPDTLKCAVVYIPRSYLLLLGSTNPSTILSRHLASPLLSYLGKISFAFYLIHTLILRYMHGLMQHSNMQFLPLASGCIFVGALLASTLSAGILYEYIEIPAQRFLRGLLKKPQNAASTPESVLQ